MAEVLTKEKKRAQKLIRLFRDGRAKEKEIEARNKELKKDKKSKKKQKSDFLKRLEKRKAK